MKSKLSFNPTFEDQDMVKVTFSEIGANITSQTHIRKFKILHFSENISESTLPHWAETANFLRKLFLRLLCSDMKIFHATGLLRYQGLQENHKRPTKVMKVKTKARDLSIPKFEKKSYLWGPLVSLVYSFSYFQVTRSLRPKRPP